MQPGSNFAHAVWESDGVYLWYIVLAYTAASCVYMTLT